MRNSSVRLFAVLSACLTLFVVQPATADPGDLWDLYAAALEAQLAGASGEALNPATLDSLPDDQLASWEPQFAADPRYWQLRWWNTTVASGPEDAEAAAGWLREGLARGAADAATYAQLYREADRELQKQDREMLTLQQGGAGLTGQELASAMEALHTAQVAAADRFVAAAPDHSLPYYTRAMVLMEWGDFELGVDDLIAGNSAQFNSALQPFPISRVMEELASGATPQHPLAAGIVAASNDLPFPNYIRIKEHFKEQQLRLLLGAPATELDPWHRFACRFGSMEQSHSVQWLVGVVTANMMVNHALVEASDQLGSDQRRSLITLQSRTRRVRDIGIELHNRDLSLEKYLTAALEQHGVSTGQIGLLAVAPYVDPYLLEPVVRTDEGLPAVVEPEDPDALRRTLWREYFAWHLERLAIAQRDRYPAVRERLAESASFDMTTFTWPGGALEPAAADLP